MPDALTFLGHSSDTTIVALEPHRLQRAKRAYTTARIDLAQGQTLITEGIRPKAGDLVLARIARLGHHKRIESPHGRRGQLYAGDEVLLCFGARYASDQFEALVPDTLEPCHMVAGGGIAARCVNRHSATRPATEIEPIGIVADAAGRPLNLKRFAINPEGASVHRPHTMAVIGTSMNAGKTTTVAALVRGLTRSGLKVAVGKVTGTGAGGDRWAFVDAGASRVLDFTDFGHASTYRVPAEELAGLLRTMSDTLAADRPDVIVLEIADGLFFSETAKLVAHRLFADRIDDVMIAAGDAMGAEAGVRRLEASSITPVAIAGRMTSSPLQVREAQQTVDQPIVLLDELMDGDWLPPRLRTPVQISA